MNNPMRHIKRVTLEDIKSLPALILIVLALTLSANYKKLNELADTENCNVNAMVSELISYYKKHKKK